MNKYPNDQFSIGEIFIEYDALINGNWIFDIANVKPRGVWKSNIAIQKVKSLI